MCICVRARVCGCLFVCVYIFIYYYFYIILFFFIIFYAMATPIYTIKAAILYRVADKSEKIEKKMHGAYLNIFIVQICSYSTFTWKSFPLTAFPADPSLLCCLLGIEKSLAGYLCSHLVACHNLHCASQRHTVTSVQQVWPKLNWLTQLWSQWVAFKRFVL